nr:FkbM family methyltransferase [Saprospiraceae bacterium]
MDKAELLQGLKRVEKIAIASRWDRFWKNPKKYADAVLYRKLFYPKWGTRKVKSETFFGKKINLLLPSGTDIFLTGGKSHPSEIRLARFLIQKLNPGNVFLDVGAHYGYFSLLGSVLVGETGKVFSFEASESTFAMLELNS